MFVIERPKQVLTKRRNVRESTELTDGFSKKLSLGGKMSRNTEQKNEWIEITDDKCNTLNLMNVFQSMGMPTNSCRNKTKMVITIVQLS